MKTYSMKTGSVKPSDAQGGGCKWQGRAALSQHEHDWLVKLKTAVDSHWDELTGFEQKFAEDLLERFRRWGVNTRISPKQWEVITRISEKVL